MATRNLLLLVLIALLGACSKKDEAPPPSTIIVVPPAQPAVPTNTAAPSASAPDATMLAKGEDVYKNTCTACHQTGVAGAPKIGDQAEWSGRVAQGNATLYQHAINGFTGAKGTMPPKGGNMALSDDEVRAAVDYVVSKAK